MQHKKYTSKSTHTVSIRLFKFLYKFFKVLPTQTGIVQIDVVT